MQPVILYLWLSLLINVLIDAMAEYNRHFPGFPFSNTALYNIHSVVRFACFVAFFNFLRLSEIGRVKLLLPLIFIVCCIYNFIFNENFFDRGKIGSNLLALESFLLLIYCLLYYFNRARQDTVAVATEGFWVVTGLSIFVVTNFFVFLNYDPILSSDPYWAVKLWDVHNVAFITFCICITKALYAPGRP